MVAQLVRRHNYMRSKLSEVHDQHKARLANSLAQYKTFSIVVGETTDAVGRCVLNTMLIPGLSGNLSGSGHLGLKPHARRYGVGGY